MELEWSPGVMQVDFGLAQAVIAGNRTDAHCLVVSFPHSNMRYAVALPGENAECVCEVFVFNVFSAVWSCCFPRCGRLVSRMMVIVP